MKTKLRTILPVLFIWLLVSTLNAGQYYALCEGNFGQANSSLWSFDDSFSTIDGPLVWDTGSNPLGDVGQSLTLHDHTLYIVMNNSHVIRILDLENGPTHTGDIDVAGASPRFMEIQASQNRGFISSWNLGGLLIVDLSSNTVVDTFLLGGLPEQLILDGDKLYVSMNMKSDWSANNLVHQLDVSSAEPVLTNTYEVIDGPGSMALSGQTLFVTSIYYNDAWESFSGTSKINLLDGTVVTVDHGAYTNYSADIAIVEDTPYRISGNFIVPLNDDLSFDASGSIGNSSQIYSFSVQNDQLLVGTSDFIAPDDILIYSPDGSTRGSLTLGALPGDAIYYDPDVVSVDEKPYLAESFLLSNNYPNPFNPTTTIPFQLNRSGHTRLAIFDARGRLVKTLMNEYLSAGNYELGWDGTKLNGKKVSSGIYFAILSSGSEQSVIKLNLIK